jgi:hypothetical protein
MYYHFPLLFHGQTQCLEEALPFISCPHETKELKNKLSKYPMSYLFLFSDLESQERGNNTLDEAKNVVYADRWSGVGCYYRSSLSG